MVDNVYRPLEHMIYLKREIVYDQNGKRLEPSLNLKLLVKIIMFLLHSSNSIFRAEKLMLWLYS